MPTESHKDYIMEMTIQEEGIWAGNACSASGPRKIKGLALAQHVVELAGLTETVIPAWTYLVV